MLPYFVLSFKVVHCLFVSLTTEFQNKAIMDPSSVQLFSNIVSVAEVWLEGAGGTLLLVFQVSEEVWYAHWLDQVTGF